MRYAKQNLLPAVLGGDPVCDEYRWPRWPVCDTAEHNNLEAVLRSGDWGGHSDEVRKFEIAFAGHVGKEYCVATANCTVALYAALRSVGVGDGDEVIVPAYTFAATAYPILLLSAVPVIVDIGPLQPTIDVRQVEAAITSRTRAIVPVHVGGHVADMAGLRSLANHHGLYIVEDSAHYPISSRSMQELATMGDIACFSFQNDKLMTAGEGGAVATDSLEHATAIRRFLNQGRSGGRFAELVSIGFNGRMTAWQAAVLSAQLDRFREQWEMRLRSAKRLGELIVETVGLTSVSARASLSSQSMYSFITEYDSAAFSGLSRDAFLAALAAEGIRCSKGYARPLHEWQAFQGAECRVLACPNAEGLCLKSVTFKHSVLLAPPARMESIAAAIHKLHRFSYELTQGEVEKGA